MPCNTGVAAFMFFERDYDDVALNQEDITVYPLFIEHGMVSDN